MAKVKLAALFLALTQLLLVCEPLIESCKASAAEAPVAVQTLDERLQRSKEARVQVGPEWLLVKSPRADAAGLRGAAIIEPDTSSLSQPSMLPWNQVEEIRLRTSLAGRGALVGALLGAILGGAVAANQSSAIQATPGAIVGDFTHPSPDPGSVAVGIVVGGLYGALLGGVTGSFFKRWTKVYP